MCLLVALATGTIGDSTDKGLVSIIALVGVAATILIGFIKRVATSYTITDRRLHIKRGIVSRTIQETRLERVQNVNYQQSVLQRLLQIGNVDFDTAAGDDYNFIFAGVADPADVVHMVDTATRRGSAEGLGDDAADRSSSRNRNFRATGRGRSGRRARALLGAEPRGLAQRVRAVGALPGEVVVVAAEVAVGGGLLVDRPVQVELLAKRARAQVEVLGDQLGDLARREILPVPNVSTITQTGCATPIA